VLCKWWSVLPNPLHIRHRQIISNIHNGIFAWCIQQKNEMGDVIVALWAASTTHGNSHAQVFEIEVEMVHLCFGHKVSCRTSKAPAQADADHRWLLPNGLWCSFVYYPFGCDGCDNCLPFSRIYGFRHQIIIKSHYTRPKTTENSKRIVSYNSILM